MSDRMSLDEMFEVVAEEQTKRADKLDNDPDYQARVEAKRQAQINNEIRQGLRDENGDYIETYDFENPEGEDE